MSELIALVLGLLLGWLLSVLIARARGGLRTHRSPYNFQGGDRRRVRAELADLRHRLRLAATRFSQEQRARELAEAALRQLTGQLEQAQQQIAALEATARRLSRSADRPDSSKRQPAAVAPANLNPASPGGSAAGAPAPAGLTPTAEAQLRELERTVNSLESQLADSQRQRRRQRLELDAAQHEVEALQRRTEEEGQSQAALQSQLMAVSSHMARLQAQLDDAQSLAGLFPIQAAEINDLRRRLATLTAEKATWQDRFDTHHRRLVAAATYVQELRRRYRFVLNELRQQHGLGPAAGAAPSATGDAPAVPVGHEPDPRPWSPDPGAAPSEGRLSGPEIRPATDTLRPSPTAETRPSVSGPAVETSTQDGEPEYGGNGPVKARPGADRFGINPAAPVAERPGSAMVDSLNTGPGGPDEQDPPETRHEPTVADDRKGSPDPDSSPQASGDDLQQIKGIGPTYAGRLREAGIRTFAALATLSADHIREITRVRADPSDWIQQATRLAHS